MRLGMFSMPAAHPERSLGEVVEWNLEVIRRAEEYGYSEIWLGEHMTARWEPLPSSLLVIARALADTERILLAPGVNVLYQHHPITLALQLAQLDHMARGRLMFGFGAGGTLTDWQLYGVDASVSQEMTSEALEIILSCWQKDGPQDYLGKYWRVCRPDPLKAYRQTNTHGWHVRLYAPADDRIALAGFSLRSPSLRLAGARGYIPMSLNIGAEYLTAHWESVMEGAASTGRTPDRRKWRHAKEVYVAETNDEARNAVLNGPMARWWNEFAKTIFFKDPKVVNMVRRRGADPNADVTPEYLVDNRIWFVGDPDRIVEQIQEQFEVTGGFGTLLQLGMDCADEAQRDGWFRSMRLLGQEVMPRVQHLIR